MSRSSLAQGPGGDPGAACKLAGKLAKPDAEGEPASIVPNDGCVRFLSRALATFSLPLFTFIVEKTVVLWWPSDKVGGIAGSSSPKHVDGGDELKGDGWRPRLCPCECALGDAVTVRLATRNSHRSLAEMSRPPESQ